MYVDKLSKVKGIGPKTELLLNKIGIYDEVLIGKTLSKANAPTAFFCTSDRVAVQMMQTLHKMHIKIPEQVSIIGFDNLPIAEITYPPLTTLAQDISQKAHLVVDMLVRHIRQKELPPERTLLGVWMVERESVKHLPSAK